MPRETCPHVRVCGPAGRVPVSDGDRMNGYAVSVSCRVCGHELDHVNTSRVYDGDDGDRQDASAIARCTRCRREWQVFVSLLPMPTFRASDADPGSEGRTHGLYGTYVRGCRCDLCRAASAQYARERRARVAV